MKQEDKELLLKDLCGRLPYGVKVCCNNTVYNIDAYTKSAFMLAETLKPDACLVAHIEEVKPYLLPFSSMGPAEYVEFVDLGDETSNDCFGSFNFDQLDWLNAHHFDYRGLIPKGLAIDATGLNIY